MRIDFTGKVAVVTGGASGIGRAIVQALEDCGAAVHVFDLNGDPPVDVSDAGSIEAAFDRVPAPDVLMINAGTVANAELTSTSNDAWRRIIETNLTGAFNTIRAGAARMRPRGGAIVLTASTNSYDGEPLLTAYNASKAGLLGLLHTAANELGPYGIRVNAVCPGLIRTPLTESHFSNPGLIKEYFRQIPMGRGGQPAEVATAAVFLASDLPAEFSGDRWRLLR